MSIVREQYGDNGILLRAVEGSGPITHICITHRGVKEVRCRITLHTRRSGTRVVSWAETHGLGVEIRSRQVTTRIWEWSVRKKAWDTLMLELADEIKIHIMMEV